MSSKFESSVKHIPYAQQKVYGMLSDLSNIERVKDRLPQDKVKDLIFDSDRVSISVAPVGQVALHIVEREEPKCIKFETEKSPVAANLWIQLLPVTETSCKIKLTIKADIPFMIKGMVSKPLTDGIEKIADILAMIPYE
ncbi:MAG: SRPBCC family protein [Prevotella sp.]|nr:SRPBCC family protein [Prevotella sp.]